MPPCTEGGGRNVSQRIFFRRININCVINKSERKGKEGRKEREGKVDFLEIGIGEKTSGSKCRER